MKIPWDILNVFIEGIATRLRAVSPFGDIMNNETTTIIQQVNAPKYAIKLKHMKSGQNIVLSIEELKVSGDDLSTVMAELRQALDEYVSITGESAD